jgi:hypothetical protein
VLFCCENLNIFYVGEETFKLLDNIDRHSCTKFSFGKFMQKDILTYSWPTIPIGIMFLPWQ